ncbi:MAG: hypothetical protein KBA91_01320 [Candidatus Moranbacteria bacterium]|nr:hypothetical protein [Candidatus Moranbacteria bacterium]
MFNGLSRFFSRFVAALATRPATSFFILVSLLFGIIVLGHFLRTPSEDTTSNQNESKKTALFILDQDTATITVPAKVKKETVVQIVALTPGIVSTIHTAPGRTVTSGQTLFTLTNDYQSGSANLRKRLAAETDALTQKIAGIDKDITALKEKQAKHDDTLSSREEDIALLALDKERASRKSALIQSTLSLQLSNVSDAAFHPKTFTAGTVQSIRVQRGDFVLAGQILATLLAPKGATTIEAFLDPDTALLFDTTKEALVRLGNDSLSLLPCYFSQSENENGLFSVLFTLSEASKNKLINGQYLDITLPLRTPDTDTALVPIDAIFQDDTAAWILVNQNDTAVAKAVKLGRLYGGFAEILSGIDDHDQVILSRAVLAGDAIAH